MMAEHAAPNPGASRPSGHALDITSLPRHSAVVPIEFLDLLAPLDDGWVPWSPDVETGRWDDGGSLAESPVDVAATFEGAVWRTTRTDDSFGLTGLRFRTGATVPRHRHDQDLLLLVVGGVLSVRFVDGDGDDVSDQVARLEAGQFAVIEADTVHSLVAGDDGATVLTCWPLRVPEVGTTWCDDPAWQTGP